MACAHAPMNVAASLEEVENVKEDSAFGPASQALSEVHLSSVMILITPCAQGRKAVASQLINADTFHDGFRRPSLPRPITDSK